MIMLNSLISITNRDHRLYIISYDVIWMAKMCGITPSASHAQAQPYRPMCVFSYIKQISPQCRLNGLKVVSEYSVY